MYTSVLLIVGCLFSGVLGKYYFVTIPNVIRYNHEETVTVSVFEVTNANVEVWLELHNKKISKRNVKVLNEKTPVKTTMIVTEADILTGELHEEKPRTVKICSQFKGQTDCQDLILSYITGHLLVQSDKPIYTPNQKVNLRALAFDESLKPIKNETVGIDIISPTNRTLGRRMIKQSSSGFFRHDFELPPHPEIGLWTARAFFKGQYETTGRALFHVQEYVLPTFGVKVKVNEQFILKTTEALKIAVLAQYVYGKPVNGNARIELYLRGDGTRDLLLASERQPMQNTQNEDSVATFNVNITDIMNSPVINNQFFPDGSRLEVVARVFEDETGNEENAIHDSTMFTENPYKFKFTQTKLNFRPGMEYFLKVQVLYANGAPVQNKIFVLKMFGQDNILMKSVSERTDAEGRIVEAFPTSNTDKVLKFEVYSQVENWKSDFFIVDAYQGKNQIQVEMVKKDGRSYMRAYTNTQGNLYTGLMFMVVTRGKVVYTKHIDSGNVRSDEISEALEKNISPSARLIVFYVDKTTNEIVADSVKFGVKHQCKGKELTLKPERSEIKPGSRSMLTLNGDPFMYVGLNIMDKALLLLNRENALKRDSMFEALESHDLGCGEGSGANSADVFKGTGLTVLTNAIVTKAALGRYSLDCDAKQRKRRHADCYDADIKCCKFGYDKAMAALYNNGYDIDPFTTCYQAAKQVVENGTAPMLCTDILGRSLGFETEYISDLEKITAAGGHVKTRSDFRESWQFSVMSLNENGENRIYLGYPDSITEWMIQAVGISNEGLCIAHPENVTTFRDFFIQLELPYKAIRLEPLDVKVTIFNYGRNKKNANVYLKGHEGLCYDAESGENSRRTQVNLEPNSAKTIRFPMVPMKRGRFSVIATALVYDNGVAESDEVKKYLLVENEGLEEQVNIQVCLDPLQQSEDCVHHKRISSEVIREGTQIVTVDLTLPNGNIPTTGSATGYLQGNLMDNVVRTLLQGLDYLFNKPHGCAEQTMIKLSPCVYAMNYLKQTKQMTDRIEKIGNKYIRYGVNREVSQFRKHDGSYYPWRGQLASTWLTAFVAKVFCQAKKVVDDSVDEQKDIALTIEWLTSHAEPDGSFVDRQPVYARRMVGQVKDKDESDPSLTAFVLVTLHECNIRSRAVNTTIKNAMAFLEKLDRNMLQNNPYVLALSTYALALSNSINKFEFMDMLKGLKKGNNRDGSYWGEAGGRHPASAFSVETTSYALLAMMQFHDMKTSGQIVTWLTSQRDSKGAFRTTQDTVIGLQALSEYSLKTYNKDLDLRVTLLADKWNMNQQLSVTYENSIAQKVIKNLPVEIGNNLLTVEVTGKGSGRLMIDLRYNRVPNVNEGCGFSVTDVAISDVKNLDVNIRDLKKCDVCGKCGEEMPPMYDDVAFGENVTEAEPKIESNIGWKKRAGRGKRVSSELKCARFSVSTTEGRTGMAMVIFGLETGVEVITKDLDKLVEETENIDAYEYDGKGFIAIYLSEITPNATDFVFRLKDTFDDMAGMRARQPSSLKVYDYYNPDKSCTKMYRTVGEAFSYECDKSPKPQCQCLQNLCIKPRVNTLISLAMEGKRPAVKLLEYMCNSDKANYAVLVTITKLSYDPSKNQKIISAKVMKSLHKGIEGLRANDEMSFFMSLNCQEPAITVGSEYFVIGKDGIKSTNSNYEVEYKYPLMGSTIVIENPKKPKELLSKILLVFQQLVMLRGCAA